MASREERTVEMMGIKGARGTVGDQGIKGDKGEKGESVTSPSSAVPQTNWKQCVWKNLNDDRDSGKIKVRVKCSDCQWLWETEITFVAY